VDVIDVAAGPAWTVWTLANMGHGAVEYIAASGCLASCHAPIGP
jgi:hypothetical protein